MKKHLLALALAATVGIAGCGNSGNDDDGGGGPNAGPVARSDIDGPVDPLQEQLSGAVFGQIGEAADGTPLEDVIEQVDKIVVDDILDIMDTYALAFAEAAAAGGSQTAIIAAFNHAAEDTRNELTNLVLDLQGLLQAMAGAEVGDDFEGNPLAGTPFAAFGSGLALVLSQLQVGLTGQTGQPDQDLLSLYNVTHQLSLAFANGLATVPDSARDAPVFGASLGLISQALVDLDKTLFEVATYDGLGTEVALKDTIDHLLTNLLTEVIPLEEYEQTPGQFTTPIERYIDTFTAAFAAGLGAGARPLEQTLDGPLSALLDPIENVLLPQLLGPFANGINGGQSFTAFLALLTGVFNGVENDSNPFLDLIDSLYPNR